MSPFGPLDSKEEDQSEAERLAVARRFRARKTEQLEGLVRPLIEAEPLAVGEFSTRPLEALAAVPLVGAFLALGSRIAGSRRKLSADVLVAVDSERVHLLSLRNEVAGPAATLLWSRPRADARVVSLAPKFMREQVLIEIDGEEKPLRLFANALRTNPWAAGVVRALGGDAPEPRDLGAAEERAGTPPASQA
jgi:hypothetical protein